MADILPFPEERTGTIGVSPRVREIDPDEVIKGASQWVDALDQVLVLGVTHDGQLYAAATHPDVADNLLLMSRFKRKIMRVFGDDDFSDAPDA